MSNDHSFAVPKPIKDKTIPEDEAVFQMHGGHGAIKAAVNILRANGVEVSTEPYYPLGDGTVKQKAHIKAAPAKRYADIPDPAYVDKSGEIYLLASLETNGRYKLGESVHPRQRLQEVVDSYGERFKIIGINYCSTDRFKRETWLKAELVRWGAKRLEREAFQMSDEIVEKFIALPND